MQREMSASEIDTQQRPQWSRRFNNRTTLTTEWAHMYPNNVQKRTEMIENH